jgi:ribosomal protein S18 acetylase RimI-like enzyme
MGLREARRDEVRQIVEMLIDDQLGKGRESLDNLSPYLQAFDAIAADQFNTQYVWDENGEIVGCLQLTVIPGLSQKGAWRAQIESVRVKGSTRGTGVGQKMMHAIMAIARERGCDQMQLTTNKVRTDAHRFYEALGFEKTHEGMKKKL